MKFTFREGILLAAFISLTLFSLEESVSKIVLHYYPAPQNPQESQVASQIFGKIEEVNKNNHDYVTKRFDHDKTFSHLRNFLKERRSSTEELVSFAPIRPAFGPFDLEYFNKWNREEFKEKILALLIRNTGESYDKLENYVDLVLDTAMKYEVDPIWALSVMWTESFFNPRAISYVGARGLMQIMPATALFLARVMNSEGHVNFFMGPLRSPNWRKTKRGLRARLYDPKLNIEMGIYYLRHLQDFFKDNMTLATVAYNMGPYMVRRRLKKGLPVGVKNQYLDKVRKAYQKIAHSLL